jgi:hypothetical protein
VPASRAGCSATDQRGVGRPQGAGCDAGAYEWAPPTAIIRTAVSITSTTATIQGQLNPNAKTASFHFEFGTTAVYGSSTPTQNADGLSERAVSADLSGLAPNTTYHYRLVATNPDGTSFSQDAAFTTAALPTSPSGFGLDTTPPVFLSASINPKAFAVNRRGPREVPVRLARVRKGTTIRYSLSESARIVFTVERVLAGRTVGGRCVAATRGNRSRRACKLYKAVGRFAAQAVAGSNQNQFSGRIGRRSLIPGAYRLTLVATDAAGNASLPRRLRFKVVPG